MSHVRCTTCGYTTDSRTLFINHDCNSVQEENLKKYQENKTGRSFEVPGREEVQKKRLDEAFAKVYDDLQQAGKPFSERLHQVTDGFDYPTVHKLAEETKTPIRTLLSWVKWGSSDIRRLASVCRHLDVSADYLLGLIDERKSLSSSKADSVFNDPICPHCGTTEMLCGHNGVGCSKESDDDR